MTSHRRDIARKVKARLGFMGLDQAMAMLRLLTAYDGTSQAVGEWKQRLAG